MSEASEAQRGRGAGGGSSELLDCSTDLMSVKGEEEGRALGRRDFSLLCSSQKLVASIP